MHPSTAYSLVLLASLALACAAPPAGLTTCADDQPDVAECRRRALQDAVPRLAAGIPELGAAPIDPLDGLPALTWQTNSRGVALKFRLDNARYSGLGRSVVDDLQVDTVNKRIRVVAHVDGLNTLEGDYTLSGRVLGVPLEGQGLFKLSMQGGAVHVTYAGHLESGQRGQSYLSVDSVTVKYEFGESQYQLTGLFGDYQPLVDAGNMFINSVTSRVVQPDMLPTLERWLAEAYRRRAQAVFSSVPFQQLFPKTSASAGFYRAVLPQLYY